jgi:hypothetical protein
LPIGRLSPFDLTMYHTLSRVTALACFTLVTTGLSVRVAAQEKDKDKAPFVRVPQLILTHAGAHAPVNAVAFSPDAGTLYGGGTSSRKASTSPMASSGCRSAPGTAVS